MGSKKLVLISCFKFEFAIKAAQIIWFTSFILQIKTPLTRQAVKMKMQLSRRRNIKHDECSPGCWEKTLARSGHKIKAGRAPTTLFVLIKTAENTTTIENRFSPRCLNDTLTIHT